MFLKKWVQNENSLFICWATEYIGIRLKNLSLVPCQLSKAIIYFTVLIWCWRPLINFLVWIRYGLISPHYIFYATCTKLQIFLDDPKPNSWLIGKYWRLQKIITVWDLFSIEPMYVRLMNPKKVLKIQKWPQDFKIHRVFPSESWLLGFSNKDYTFLRAVWHGIVRNGLRMPNLKSINQSCS